MNTRDLWESRTMIKSKKTLMDKVAVDRITSAESKKEATGKNEAFVDRAKKAQKKNEKCK